MVLAVTLGLNSGEHPERRQRTRDEALAANAQLNRTFEDLQALAREHRRCLAALEESQRDALARLAHLSELARGGSLSRLVKLGRLAARIGLATGLPQDQCALLCRAAPLLDVGDVSPQPTAASSGARRRNPAPGGSCHTLAGAAILADNDHPLFVMARGIVRHHHERWDGKGFPSGLAAGAIPLPAQIASAAEYCEMLIGELTTPSPDVIRDCIALESGGRFAPKLALAMSVACEELLSIVAATDAQYRDRDPGVFSSRDFDWPC